ncbi:MAG TPA: SRPBCC family protein [Candidatus Acidoferrales bacterium]|nr:SRPBCC family protein [Candidatus Acidoferrales bacterium]
MTTKTNEIFIDAPAQAIYRLAATTERWPEYLPHYRRVRVVSGDDRRRVVEMAAWRDVIPIRWVAEQINDPDIPHIAFRHIAGWTKGMEVEWIFTPQGNGTRVQIVHRLQFRFPFASEWLGEYVVGDFFIHYVASKTLARMKRLVEGEGGGA